MPIKIHEDLIGPYFQYGKIGHKYYFNPRNQGSFNRAHDKAIKQVVAIMFNKKRKSNK